MTIIERFKRLNMPADQCVVIGSGILDALKLRTSNDIDLVVSDGLFEAMRSRPEWRAEQRHGETVLLMDDVELWRSWGSPGGAPNFDQLFQESVLIEGVYFAHPRFVMAWKRQRAMEKDLRDVHLLEEYLMHESSN